MEYKTPKSLERKPMIFGYPVITAMIVILCLMLFLFTVFKNIILSLVFIITPLLYLYIIRKYPKRGEFKEFFFDFKIGVKCIRFDEKLENLINMNPKDSMNKKAF
ncbi:VirB3 family type IV secretion system protein [Chryseobacterium candidae]|uniref:PrgI family protein n=1 Tax=Chryseobacterium candidae TaxID=1978493 RepID=A0ABY2R4X7_9FLAO|nr:VirB3 family type IV secretion system protein [Chryseobacterium candidae]THV57557.1 hypothetical protein EK417_16200 [Chryseobacterium candidae]